MALVFDIVLGILGLIWLVLMAPWGWIAYSKVGYPGVVSVVFWAFAVPNLVCFVVALVRLAYFGSPFLALGSISGGVFIFLALFGIGSMEIVTMAVLWFVGVLTLGLGEMFAVVAVSQEPERWKLDRVLPVWQLSFGTCVVVIVSLFCWGFYHGGKEALLAQRIPFTGRQIPRQTTTQRSQDATPPVHIHAGPPTPQIARPNLDKEFAALDHKVANRDALARLLETVRDDESAKSVAAKYKELQAAYQSMETPSMPPTATADQQRRYSEFLRRDAEATARIAKEEFRVRAIPGAAEPLGLTARIPDPSENPPIRPERPRQRPEPTTPEEQINYAIEDLERGDVFKRREAAKTLRSIEVDEFRRDEVSKALQQVITDRDPFLKEDAVAALVKWGTRKNMASLMDLLDGAKHSHGDTRKHAIRALAQFKEDKCARAIAKMLFTDDWMVAVDALKEMGPVSEAAVLGQIDNDDPKMRFQVCGILEEVGSSFSLDDLKRHASGDRVREVKQAAKDAVKAIEARSGKSTKSGKSR